MTGRSGGERSLRTITFVDYDASDFFIRPIQDEIKSGFSGNAAQYNIIAASDDYNVRHRHPFVYDT